MGYVNDAVRMELAVIPVTFPLERLTDSVARYLEVLLVTGGMETAVIPVAFLVKRLADIACRCFELLSATMVAVEGKLRVTDGIELAVIPVNVTFSRITLTEDVSISSELVSVTTELPVSKD